MEGANVVLCKECGSSLSEGARFCKQCGAPVEEIKQTANTSPSLTNQTVPRTSMSKSQKRMLAIAGIALAVLLAGYKTGEALTSKDRLIKRFETALVEKDEEAVADLLTSNDPKLKIDEKSVKGFMKYLEQHPEEVHSIIQTLKMQSKFMEETEDNRVPTEGYIDYTEGIVNLEKDGKILFYDKYELNIEPVYLTISTNYKDTKIYMDGKEIGKSDTPNYEKTFGPYVPGIYTLQAKLKNDFIDLVKIEEVSLVESGEKVNVNLDLDGQDVTLDFGLEEEKDIKAELLINRKNVGINPFKESTFGPVLTDGSMTLSVEAEMPWGKIKTKEIPIDSDYIEVNLGSDENFQKNIMDLIVKHMREMMVAYTSGDPNKLTTATQNYKEMLQQSIEEDKEYGNFYKGKYLGTTFDLDSFNLEYEDGEWVLYVNTRSKFFEDIFYEGETPELEEGEEDNTVKLVYDDATKSWIVDDMYESSDFNTENIKEVKEENPQEYVSSWATDVPTSSSTE